MTHCCVIGGAGFIGRRLVAMLLETGRAVTVIGRSHEPALPLPFGVLYLAGNMADATFVKKVLADVNEVVDLAYASVPKTSFDNPVEDILGNLPAAVNLFQVASDFPLDKIVVVSSGGVIYGEAEGLPITETHPTNPTSPYGITKLAVEKYALMYRKIKQLPVICVRPGNAYGEGQKPFVGQGFIATAIGSILAGREIVLFGEGQTIRDYIHVDDVASGIVAALEQGALGECYNIGTGIGLSNRDVVEKLFELARQTDLVPQIKSLSSRKFDVAANILDSNKLNIAAGWFPRVAFDEGLGRTWAWHLRRKYET